MSLIATSKGHLLVDLKPELNWDAKLLDSHFAQKMDMVLIGYVIYCPLDSHIPDQYGAHLSSVGRQFRGYWTWMIDRPKFLAQTQAIKNNYQL